MHHKSSNVSTYAEFQEHGTIFDRHIGNTGRARMTRSAKHNIDT